MFKCYQYIIVILLYFKFGSDNNFITMGKNRRLLFFCFYLLLFSMSLESANEYCVRFQGIENQELLKLIESASQLSCLQDHPPKTIAALRRRAEGDISNIESALQSQGYYSSRVDFAVNSSTTPNLVTVKVDLGELYAFGKVTIIPENLNIEINNLEICEGKAALPKDIVKAENLLIDLLAKKGYPLAILENRQVIADDDQNQVHVTFYIKSGPLVSFGETSISGHSIVEESVIRNKICWKEGDLYDPEKVEQTIIALESSRLFSSINIIHADEPDFYGRLPMSIQVIEGKPRSIGLGASYSTQRGPGFTGEWEHRNFLGKGDRFKITTNLQKDQQDAIVSYLIPDVGLKGQDLLWKLEGQHDITKGFEETSFSFSGTLERQLNSKIRFSYGAMYKQLKIGKSDNNGSYSLIKTPLQLKLNNTDNILNPTIGYSLYFKTIPSVQIFTPQFGYLINNLTGAIYYPLSNDRSFILAAKASFGSIWGPSRHTIPPSERFYAGSESTLRGYKYYTVSPLDSKDKPIGGRSMMIYSLETRWRPTEKWGGVLFYDVGNVFTSSLPQFDKKLLQSIGVGLRYYTPFAPLRLDVAFPLNRRKGIDPAWQIYFSVGQSF
jgi:translocation and assembly module TamA